MTDPLAPTGPSAEASDDFLGLGDEPFVSLSTFRRSGQPVSTPVWIARDGETLVVTTPAGSGKVKRLRHTPQVELRPSGRMGAVAPGVEPVAGVVEIVADDAESQRLTGLIAAKYGLEYRIVMGIERLGGSRGQDRVLLRIRAR